MRRGWTAEIEVPFKTVNFDPNTDTWGANFQRTVKRKNQESLWTVGWQLRFRWIQKPGNDVFFIWTQNWRDEIGRGFGVLDRLGVAKIVRTIRF